MFSETDEMPRAEPMASPRNEPTVSKASSAVVSASSPLRMKSLLCTMRTGTASAARESGSSAAEVCRSVNQPRTVEAIVVSPASPNSGVCTSRKRKESESTAMARFCSRSKSLAFLSIAALLCAAHLALADGQLEPHGRAGALAVHEGEGAVMALDDLGGDG